MYLLISLILIFYYIYLKVFYGGLSFSIFFVILAIILIMYNLIKDNIRKISSIYNITKYFMIIFFSLFIFIESLIILYPKYNISDNCDYIMILGAAVKGSTPSTTLKGRLDTALDFINNIHNSPYIVVSGGKGNKEDISEALAMKIYLIKNNISPDKIIIEDRSTNTFENFLYSKEKIENHSNNKITNLNIKVITTDFHALRSSLIAKRNGYSNISFYCSRSLPQFIPTYYTREFFAFIKTLIFDD